MDQRSFVQDRLRPMQGRNIRALEEFSDRDFLTPKQRFSHRGCPVRGVIRGVFLKLFHPWSKPLVSVVMIIGDARAEDVQEREAFVLNAVLDEFREVFLLAAEAASNESGACG